MSLDPAATGLREKQRRTRAELISEARRRTAEGGLTSFTVQQLADTVGISRRSFFNHFKSKESAVLGIENGVDEEHLATFLAARRRDPDVRRDLVDDLVDLVLAHFSTVGPQASEATELLAAMKRSPKLIGAFLETGQIEQERFVTLLAEHDASLDREGAEVAFAVFGSLIRLSAEAFFRDGNTVPFAEILQSRIRAARTLFPAPSSLRTKDLVTTT